MHEIITILNTVTSMSSEYKMAVRPVFVLVMAVLVAAVVLYYLYRRNDTHPHPLHFGSKMRIQALPFSPSTDTTTTEIRDGTNHETNRTVTMLFWTSYFGITPWLKETRTVRCGQYQCLMTSDHKFFRKSEVLVFHGKSGNLQSYLREAIRLDRPPQQRWLLFIRESPINTPYLGTLNGFINWTVGYMTDSDVTAGPFVLPGAFEGGFDSKRNYLENKTKLAVILTSRCRPQRMKWVNKLQEYINVDVYGKCGDLKCGDRENCFAILRQYKFYLAIENSFCKDYITEKFYENALKNGVVPVTLTRANTSDVNFVPPRSFISVLDFHTVKDLADYLIKVGNNPDLYNRYFMWRSKYTPKYVYEDSIEMYCKVCESAHLDRDSVNSHPDLPSWYSKEKNCEAYPIPQ